MEINSHIVFISLSLFYFFISFDWFLDISHRIPLPLPFKDLMIEVVPYFSWPNFLNGRWFIAARWCFWSCRILILRRIVSAISIPDWYNRSKSSSATAPHAADALFSVTFMRRILEFLGKRGKDDDGKNVSSWCLSAAATTDMACNNMADVFEFRRSNLRRFLGTAEEESWLSQPQSP